VAAPTAGQREAFDAVYGVGRSRWAFHDDPDPLVRYLRDRRLALGLERLEALTPVDRAAWTVLVVCGGVGGEATWLLDNGFAEVTVSDFSANALAVCAEREPRATTLELDAEGPAVGDSSYDLVLVQDGLHHLRRPVLGFTEMLRVARRAVVVIEPHDGLVGRLLGRTWEEHDGVRNYVFRWTGRLLEQATRSYVPDTPVCVDAHRFWDHNLAMGRLARLAGGGERGLRCAQRAYGALRPFGRLGNMMLGVTVIGDAAELDGTARKLIHGSRLRSPGWVPTDGLENGGRRAFKWVPQACRRIARRRRQRRPRGFGGESKPPAAAAFAGQCEAVGHARIIDESRSAGRREGRKGRRDPGLTAGLMTATRTHGALSWLRIPRVQFPMWGSVEMPVLRDLCRAPNRPCGSTLWSGQR
jgi:SAM-dependent methyltransferase